MSSITTARMFQTCAKILSLSLFSAFIGCSASSPEALLSRYQIEFLQNEFFMVCVAYGCRHRERTFLDPQEWETVTEMMKPNLSDSPEMERERISETIGLLERIVGSRTGTEHNKARNRPGPPGTRQLDCIAEMVNTNIYLLLLDRDNLLKYHRVAEPARRGPLNLSFWHNTAVIEEKDTGNRYAVDPWFYDNGHPATIIPLDTWMSGYFPD
jgi:hypothetical protein